MRSPTAELLLFCACDDGSVADVDDVADPLEQDEDFAADVAKLAESESKQQTAEYTWSQTADEVTFEMPVRFQTERRVFYAPCDVRKGGGKVERCHDGAKSLHVALHSTLRSSPFVPRGANTI
jgi:hypothetical protein